MLKAKTLNKTVTTALILSLALTALSVINININIIEMPSVYGANIGLGSATYFYVNTTHWSDASYHASGTPLAAALAAASAGVTINVTAGQYNGTYTVPYGVYLTSASGAESTKINGKIGSIGKQDVTIEGFHIFAATSGYNIQLPTVSPRDNTTIRNCIINSTGSLSQGISTTLDQTNLTIQGNTFYLDGTGGDVGIDFNPESGDYTSVDVNITQNVFVATGTTNAMKFHGLNDTYVTHNTINRTVVRLHLVDSEIDNVTIAYNTWYGGGASSGLLIYEQTENSTVDRQLTNLNVYNNTFRDLSSYGILFLDASLTEANDLDANTISIYYNNFQNITKTPGAYKGAVNNSIAGVTINATLNWWGDDTGPSGAGSGDGDLVSSYVDYDPWIGMYSKSITPVSVRGGITRLFNITVTNTGSNPSIGCVNITYPSSGWTYVGYTTPAHWYKSKQVGNTLVFRADPGYYLAKTQSVTFRLNMTPTADGNWTVACLNANDEAGYLPPPLEVQVDSTDPIVTIPTLPTYYSVQDGNRIYVNGTIWDDTYSTPSLVINDTTHFPANPQVLTYNASATSYTWYFRFYNTSAVSDGTLAVNVTGTDAAGNVESGGNVVSTTIDNSAPTIISVVVMDDKIGNLTSVGNTFYMSGEATGLNFTVRFSEAHPYNNVTYIYNGTGTTSKTFQNNTWFYSGAENWYNVTGINTVTISNITITDAALPNNNTLTTTSYTIIRDQEGPTVPTYTVTEICGGLIVKSLNSTDNVGVLKYEVYVNGTSFLNVTATQLANTTLDWVTGALNASCVFDGTLVLNLTNYAGGHANLTIRAVDIGGNSGNFSTPTVYTTAEGRWYPLELQVNWNLIGLPLIPASTARADVLSLILKQGAAGVRFVYGYNNNTDAWVLNPSTMEDGMGYWINMEAYDVLIVSGRISAPPPALPPNYYLTTGWVLAGYKCIYSMNVTTYLSSLPSGSYFTYIYVWNAQTQSWVMKSAGNNLDPGTGFWIWMYSDQTLIPPIP